MLSMILAAATFAAEVPPANEDRTATIVVRASEHQSERANAKLRRRIAAAIEEVCGSFATIESFQDLETSLCWKRAWRSADRQLMALRDQGEIRLARRELSQAPGVK